jgi:hypothetical protein
MISCKRCGFTSPYKHVIVNHLKKQTPCDPSVSNIDCETLITELETPSPKKKYACQCGSRFTTTSARSRHRKKCNVHQQAHNAHDLDEEESEDADEPSTTTSSNSTPDTSSDAYAPSPSRNTTIYNIDGVPQNAQIKITVKTYDTPPKEVFQIIYQVVKKYTGSREAGKEALLQIMTYMNL